MQKRIAWICVLAVCSLGLAGSAWGQTVLNFDDIQTNGGVVNMPAGYGGFSWPDTIGAWEGVPGSYPAESPPNVVLFNNNGNFGYGETDIFTLSGTVEFMGAYFSGPAQGGPIYFNLYDDGTLVATSAQMTPNPNTPEFLASGYSGQVNEIGVVGNDGYFVMDNFEFSSGSGGSTPEPGSFALFGTGIVAIATAMRRKLKM